MSDVIFLSNVRLSFPNLAQPQVQKNELTGAERVSYNCELIMPQEHPGLAQFMQRYATMAQEKWKEHAQTVMQMIQTDRKLRCFGAGQEKVNSRTFQPYDGYPGMYFITVGAKNRPQMIQPDGSPVNPDDSMAYTQLARKLYGGCRVNAAIRPWLQENKHGRGVRCDLIAIQFAADDKPFGESAPDVSNLFGATQAPAPAPLDFSKLNAPQMPAAPFGQPAVPPNNLPPGFGQPQMPSFLGR
jgi:hypothetical protein